jgi:hypothetical protein
MKSSRLSRSSKLRAARSKSAREKGLAVGRVANRRENGAMPLGQTEAGLPGGVYRMDGGRTSEALHLRRHAR